MEIILIIFIVGMVPLVGYLYKQSQDTRKILSDKQPTFSISEDEAIKKASAKAASIMFEAEKKALEITSESEKKAISLRRETEADLNQSKERISQEQRNLDKREQSLIERAGQLDAKYEELSKEENKIEQQKKQLKAERVKIITTLEDIAKLTKEEAEKRIKDEVEQDLSKYTAQQIRETERKLQKTVDERAKEMLVDVMQNSASEYVAETTSTTFDIANEELKGKIIGKEGRNIRTLQRLTGVDIIVDEGPNQVTVSCFDPIRREVAAIAIQRLLGDGRVHPGSIEEMVIKVKGELAKEIKRNGEEIAELAGFEDLPAEIILLLGRFKYRFSYGQNLAKHSLEMVNIGSQLATELKADVRLTKLACLLHDLGKVLAHEQEGKPHHHISGELIRKYLKDEKLANAAESHHGDIAPKSIEAILVQVADSISASRPGSRNNSHEDYVKRIRALEEIAKQYPQVSEAYAIHAGKEVRVIIDPKLADDDQTEIVCHKIAREIESTQNYPGSVKVTAIREYRVEGEAK